LKTSYTIINKSKAVLWNDKKNLFVCLLILAQYSLASQMFYLSPSDSILILKIKGFICLRKLNFFALPLNKHKFYKEREEKSTPSKKRERERERKKIIYSLKIFFLFNSAFAEFHLARLKLCSKIV
jgi:hypothetical protein